MKVRSYNKEIKIATKMLIDVFNDIIIDRRDSQDNIQKYISVPCIYGNRSRILKSLENRNKTLKIPLSCLSITGISRDSTRVHSVNDFLKLNSGSNFDHRNMIAQPIDITYSLGFITRYQEDMDQLIGNFIPFFNPDIYVVFPAPYNIGNLKTQILWDGGLDIEYPTDSGPEEPYRITTDVRFTLKTWLFPGMHDKDNPAYPFGQKLIYKVNYMSQPVSGVIPEGQIATLDSFFEVPGDMAFDEFQDNILSGFIKYPNFDNYPYPHKFDEEANNELSGVLSGETAPGFGD
jgi:hypothetical protein